MSGISSEHRAASRHFGGGVRCVPVPGRHGRSRVSRVVGEDGSTKGWLKSHDSRLKQSQEVEALVNWAPRVEVLGAPRLLERDGDWLVLSHCRGITVETVEWSASHEEESVHEHAGRVLRALHDSTDADEGAGDVGLEDAFAQRRDRAMAGVSRVLGHVEIERAAFLLSDASAFSGRRRVRAHRDYHPRNWLLDLDRAPFGFSVIDFEHARLDDRMIDFVRLREDPEFAGSELEKCLMRGYGRSWEEADLRVLHALELVHALNTTGWGRRRGLSDIESTGRTVLDRLLS